MSESKIAFTLDGVLANYRLENNLKGIFSVQTYGEYVALVNSCKHILEYVEHEDCEDWAIEQIAGYMDYFSSPDLRERIK